MISVDQLRIIQKKVTLLTHRYRAVVEENTVLKKKLHNYKQRVSELESSYATIQEDQGEMEGAIMSTLMELEKAEGQYEQGIAQNHTPDKTALSHNGLEL